MIIYKEPEVFSNETFDKRIMQYTPVGEGDVVFAGVGNFFGQQLMFKIENVDSLENAFDQYDELYVIQENIIKDEMERRQFQEQTGIVGNTPDKDADDGPSKIIDFQTK